MSPPKSEIRTRSGLPHVEIREAIPPEDVTAEKGFYFDSDVQARDFSADIPHYVSVICKLIASLSPSSVLEFGCNAGRNLAVLKELLPAAAISGVDLNPLAIEFGRRQWGLNLEVADETFLRRVNDNSYDVSFTISVLDHIPYVDTTIFDLIRVTRDYVIAYEICHKRSGKIIRMQSPEGEIVDGYPFSYFHDYRMKFEAMNCWNVMDVALPAFRGNLGEFYRLQIFTKRHDLFGAQLVRGIDLIKFARQE